jgi:hypothetical protein
MKNTAKLSLLTIVSIVLAAMPLHAADKPEPSDGAPHKEANAAANPNRGIPFHGKLGGKTDSSITVGTRTFEVTPDTKMMKAGNPATLADATVGEDVGGSYQEKDGKLVAKSVRFGAKPEKAATEKKAKKAEATE